MFSCQSGTDFLAGFIFKTRQLRKSKLNFSYHTTDTRCSDSQYTNHLKLKLIDTLVELATNTDLCIFVDILVTVTPM